MMKTQADNEREPLGALLRRTRQERGLTFDQAVDATKISPKSLKALEEDDYANLPAEAFVRGFYTIYAGYLALDQDEVRSRYNQQKRSQPKGDERDSLTPGELALQIGSMAEPSLVTSRSVAGLSLFALLLAAITACWYYSFNPAGYLSHMLSGAGQSSTTVDQPAATAPPAPDQPAATPAPPPSAAPATPAPGPVAAERADQGGMTATAPAAPPTAPSAAPSGADAAGTAGGQATPTPPLATGAAPPAVPVPAAYTLRATFTQATRLTVKIDDQPAQHLEFAAGATNSWRAGRSIVLTLPAGTAEMFLNGLPLAQPAKAAGEEITISIPPHPPQ